MELALLWVKKLEITNWFWEVQEKNGRLFASPADDEHFFVELDSLKATPDDGEAVIKEAKASMAETFEDLKFEEDVQKAKIGGLGIVTLIGSGKDENGKVAVNLVLIVDEAKNKVCLLTRISSPESAKKHAASWGKVVSSIAAPKKDEAAHEEEAPAKEEAPDNEEAPKAKKPAPKAEE